MNKLKTTDLGGFPVKLDDFRFAHSGIQEALKGIISTYGIEDSTAVILSGCVKTMHFSTVNISEGYISIGGEICYAPAQSYEAPEFGYFDYWMIESSFDTNGLKQFQNLSMNNTYEVRIGKVQISNSIPSGFSSVSSVKTVLEIIKDNISYVPSGAIMMWAGSIASIPSGYRLCDGTSGAPDLRSRFILGYDPTNVNNNTIGETGGNDTITLTVDQLPAHNHTGTFSGGPLPNHTHYMGHTGGTGGTDQTSFTHAPGDMYNVAKNTSNPNSNPNVTGTISINDAGSGDSIDIRPKYYTLAFIQKT